MCLQKVIKDGVIENAVDYENIVPHCGLYIVISYLFVAPDNVRGFIIKIVLIRVNSISGENGLLHFLHKMIY